MLRPKLLAGVLGHISLIRNAGQDSFYGRHKAEFDLPKTTRRAELTGGVDIPAPASNAPLDSRSAVTALRHSRSFLRQRELALRDADVSGEQALFEGRWRWNGVVAPGRQRCRLRGRPLTAQAAGEARVAPIQADGGIVRHPRTRFASRLPVRGQCHEGHDTSGEPPSCVHASSLWKPLEFRRPAVGRRAHGYQRLHAHSASETSSFRLSLM